MSARIPSLLVKLFGLWLGCCAADGILPSWDSAGAQTVNDPSSVQNSVSGGLIERIGIAGVWKLGHPCAVRLTLSDQILQQATSVEVTTLDGDGVEVAYRRELMGQSVDPVELMVKIGRRQSLISAVVKDAAGRELSREDRRLSDTEGLDATQPLLLALGSSMGVEQLARNSVGDSRSSISIVQIDSAEDLPRSWIELQAFDLLLVSSAHQELLSHIDAVQWSAMDSWIRRGGGCVVSLAACSQQQSISDSLLHWLPGIPSGEGLIRNPAPLESLVSTDQPLQPFPYCQLSKPEDPNAQRGQVRLGLTDTLGQRAPWWFSLTHGRGLVQVVASDLDHASFAQWKHRRLLWEKLIAPYLETSQWKGESRNAGKEAASFVGYSDLSGQLRATLEQFPGVQTFSFSQAALLLIAILILLGPVDYWISVRWLKRPHLSWPIASATGLIVSAGLVWYFQTLRPDRVMVNTARVVDLDAQTGRLDGHLWSHVYSAHARRLSIRSESDGAPRSIHLDWQGMPGTGLGGLESQMQFERGMPLYLIDIGPDENTVIRSVGIPAAGTKRFCAAWTQVMPLQHHSTLREMSGLDQLEGDVVNPLSVELKDVILFYHRWFYPLKGRMPPGDRSVISAQIIPRDQARRLNRQQEIDGKITSARWDPADRGQVDRVLELMMFHQAASGRNYTSLTHRYQPILDSSNLLDSECAVLVGRMDEAPLKIRVATEDSNDAPSIQSGIDFTWCRIFIPVDVSHKRTR